MSGRCYGRLSRLTENPNPRKYVSVQPMFDPAKPLRFCELGGHWCTDDAPDADGKGCPEHPHKRWRVKGHSRWCEDCKKFRPRSRFGEWHASNQTVSRICMDCQQQKAA